VYFRNWDAHTHTHTHISRFTENGLRKWSVGETPCWGQRSGKRQTGSIRKCCSVNKAGVKPVFRVSRKCNLAKEELLLSLNDHKAAYFSVICHRIFTLNTWHVTIRWGYLNQRLSQVCSVRMNDDRLFLSQSFSWYCFYFTSHTVKPTFIYTHFSHYHSLFAIV